MSYCPPSKDGFLQTLGGLGQAMSDSMNAQRQMLQAQQNQAMSRFSLQYQRHGFIIEKPPAPVAETPPPSIPYRDPVPSLCNLNGHWL